MTQRKVDSVFLAENIREELKIRDRRHKILLLISSLLTIGILSIAAIKENVYPPWRLHQLEYLDILREKAKDEWGRKLADDFEVKVRQVVVPELGVVDRCVSCHVGIDDPRMTNVPNPYKVHPGTYLKYHDVSKYGCTICHRGQGRSVVFNEAKAVGYFWDYPLLPKNLTQSACGLCHSAAEVENAGGEKYTLGESLFTSRGCFACHKLGGKGGNLGLELDREGSKVKAQLVMTSIKGEHTLPEWLKEHFEDPQRVIPGSLMKPSDLVDEEVEALTIYMLSLQGIDFPSSYLTPKKHLALYERVFPGEISGEMLFTRFCSTCHDTGRYARYDKFFMHFFPAVGGSTYIQIASREYMRKTILSGHPGTKMPPWDIKTGGLTGEEIDRIIDYLRDFPLKDSEKLPRDVVARALDGTYKAVGDVNLGRTIFYKNCVACHAGDGSGLLGPSLNNPVFQANASDGFIYTTIAHGRMNTPMPGFFAPDKGGFGEHEIESLVTFVRTLAPKETLTARKDTGK
jgi:mono/diheme cytochrome c family protein